MTPHAPCTTSCIRNEPRHSMAAVCEYANSGTIGSPSTAQNTTVWRRPNLWDSDPKVSPPTIAPTLYVTTIHLAVTTDSPAPPLWVADRKVGYTSWVPWLIQLKAVISSTR